MKLKGFRVAILACDGFEETELAYPKRALEKEKALVHLIAPKTKKIKSWRDNKWHKSYPINVLLEKAQPKSYDALLLPGGVINPDKLRTSKTAIKFIEHFFKKNKPIAAICHGPLSLIETKRLRNRHLTSYHSIKTDLLNAGAKWENKAVVQDHKLITSRHPKDLPLFIKALIQEFVREKDLIKRKNYRKDSLIEIIKKPFIK